MQIRQAPNTGTIMAIAAHPDDIESWCAGTLAQSIKLGAAVRLLLVTSGEHGSNDLEAEPEVVGAIREKEARLAAGKLGLAEVAFLRYPDGEVEDTNRLREDLVRWIRRWRPEVLFTHDPEHTVPPYLCHRDHRITGRLALDAAYPLARDHLAFRELALEGLKPHAIKEVWLFASSQPNVYVDISQEFNLKLEARLAHESQTVDDQALAEGWQERAAKIGQIVGLPLAESFTVLSLD
jgi:LmbE family N-acetylglucosaminyl deacetylase